MQPDTAHPTNHLPPGWRVVRFGEVVRNVNANERNPLEAGLERYVGLEHLNVLLKAICSI